MATMNSSDWMLHLDVRWFSSTWTQMFLETQKILWSTVMSCPTGQEGSNLNGEQYGQFFSCKYAVASNPIRIRLKFSGHKFTIIYSHLDVIKEERKNTSDPYGITQLLYTIVPSHIIPPFFHSIPSLQKIQPHYNKNSQCGFHHMTSNQTKSCHLGRLEETASKFDQVNPCSPGCAPDRCDKDSMRSRPQHTLGGSQVGDTPRSC